MLGWLTVIIESIRFQIRALMISIYKKTKVRWDSQRMVLSTPKLVPEVK